MRIAGIILAGGEGRRMGGADKAFLMLAGRPMLTHVMARFSPQVDVLALSANGDLSRFAAFDLPVLNDGAHNGSGPLAGVLAGLLWASGQGVTHLATVAVDTPLLPCDLVARLMLAGDGCAAFAESAERAHPTAALWPLAVAPVIESALRTGERRMRAALALLGPSVARFDPYPHDPFANANTPDDLAALERMLGATVP